MLATSLSACLPAVSIVSARATAHDSCTTNDARIMEPTNQTIPHLCV